MKIIGAILLALVAGTSSSTDADKIKPKLQSLCDKNGRPEAYESIRIAHTNMENTFASTTREIVAGFLNSNHDMDAGITVYCDKVGILGNTIDGFAEAVIPCLTPTDRDLALVIMRNLTVSMLQFPCANRNLVKDFFNSNDRQCLVSKIENLLNCTENILLETRNTTIVNIPSSEIDLDETILSEHESRTINETCSEIQTLEQCTVTVLAECEDQVFSTTLNSLYKYMNNDLPCENLPKSPK